MRVQGIVFNAWNNCACEAMGIGIRDYKSWVLFQFFDEITVDLTKKNIYV